MLKLQARTALGLAMLLGAVVQAQTTADRIADLSQVPQIHETKAQRDARMQWFRDAKFGMFIHWGPCSVGQKEIGWGREANRPWDINEHGPAHQRSGLRQLLQAVQPDRTTTPTPGCSSPRNPA